MKKMISGATTMRATARLTIAVTALAGMAFAAAARAEAKVQIDVDLDAQTIHVVSKDHVYDWKVSSGKPGYDTPVGKFKVLWMDKDHHSDTYEQAWMPNAIFFAPGYALHGFGKSPWGHKASHGCVRLPSADAALLFDMVKADGGTADITITGQSSVTMATVKAKLAERNAMAATDGASRGATDNAGYAEADGYGAAPNRYYDPYDRAPVQRYQQQQPQQQPLGGLFGSFY